MKQIFDADRIIGIEIYPRRETSYKWLPEKQKTWFFGLFKRNSWYSEGFYPRGCYQECYESGCWDVTPSSQESLIESGYQIEDRKVWNKPHVRVFLESKYQVNQVFETIAEAEEWVDTLVKASGKTFEIIKK